MIKNGNDLKDLMLSIVEKELKPIEDFFKEHKDAVKVKFNKQNDTYTITYNIKKLFLKK